MTPIVIHNLPLPTEQALHRQARRHNRTVEQEVRQILADALPRARPPLVDLVATRDGANVTFDPDRLRLTVRMPQP